MPKKSYNIQQIFKTIFPTNKNIIKQHRKCTMEYLKKLITEMPNKTENEEIGLKKIIINK